MLRELRAAEGRRLEWRITRNPSSMPRAPLKCAKPLFWRNLRWCSGGDSNPHTSRHMNLNHACLPIPPPEHRVREGRNENVKRLGAQEKFHAELGLRARSVSGVVSFANAVIIETLRALASPVLFACSLDSLAGICGGGRAVCSDGLRGHDGDRGALDVGSSRGSGASGDSGRRLRRRETAPGGVALEARTGAS